VKVFKEVRIILDMKSVNNPISAVIFDIGGVLSLGKSKDINLQGHRTYGVHQYISKKLHIPLDQWFDAIDSTYADAIEGKISEKKALKIISKNTNIPEAKLRKIILKSYKKNFKHNKKLYKFAFKLKKAGYKIAILSDQWPLSREVLVHEKFTKYFHPVVVSCDIGIRKPNPKIYKLILKKLKLPARECVFIDNQTWNLKPAKKLGFKTVLFKDNKQLFKQLFKLGIAV